VYEGQELSLAQLNNLQLVPAHNFNGRLWLRWNATDGQSYAVQDATTTLTVIPVEDPPSFVPDRDQITVEEDAPEQTFNWAVDIRYPDGDVRDLRFAVCPYANTELFSSGPRISAGGNLIFTPTKDANGRADLHILLTDALPPEDGNEAAVCANKITVPLTIIVEPVNDAPVISTTLTVDRDPQEKSLKLLDDTSIADPDEPYAPSFAFEGGYLDLSLISSGNETLSLSAGANVTLSGDDVKLDNNIVGILSGDTTTHLRITGLTSFATISAVEAILGRIHIRTNALKTLFVTITLNDGGNVDRQELPAYTTIVVQVNVK
jgi:hypothetical protein